MITRLNKRVQEAVDQDAEKTHKVTAKPATQTKRNNSKYLQGYYTLTNPEKYIGDPTKIRYMSSWEFEAHRFFDNNTRVIKWSSEPIGIPYIKPTDGKIHRYYVDYYCEYVDVDGVVNKELIELKPMDQVKAPRGGGKSNLYAQLTYAVNLAKWAAAEEYCKQHGMRFHIITEQSVFK